MKISITGFILLTGLFAPIAGIAQSCSADFDYFVQDAANTYFFTPKVSKGAGFNYLWNFGDGKQSVSESPVHKYNSNGTYTVSLLVYKPGCRDSVKLTLTAKGQNPCNADFLFFKDPGSSTKFQFVARDSSHQKYAWQFPGTTLNGTRVNYNFGSEGTYNICLLVENKIAHCINKICKQIKIVSPCRSDFTAIVTDTLTTFRPLEYGIGDKLLWSLGDGKKSNLTEVKHRYAQSGNYQVCLKRICLSGDSTTSCKTVFAKNCHAVFNYQLSDSTLTGSLTTASPLSAVSWSFGDGSGDTGKTIRHTYKEYNTYKVCFSANCRINDTYTSCVTLDVKKCNAEFTVSVKDSGIICRPLNQKPGINYLWNFGDGNTSALKEPVYKYKNPGKYLVTLTVTDSASRCKIMRDQSVIIPSPCIAGFKFSIKDSLLIYGSNLQNYKAVRWNFGDFNTSFTESGNHVFTKPGIYEVCQNVLCLNSDSAQICTTLVINKGKWCNLNLKINYKSDSIPFANLLWLNTSAKKYDVLWTQKGNYISNKKVTLSQYAIPGLYRISLSVYDSVARCYDTTSRMVPFHELNRRCETAISFKSSAMNPLDYEFMSFTPYAGTSHKWYVDGNRVGTDLPYLVLRFPAFKTYRVTLETHDSLMRCFDSASVILKPVPPCQDAFITQIQGLKVLFKPIMNYLQYNYEWDFGDSTFSKDRSPVHIYKRPGTYKVCQTIQCGGTNTSTACMMVKVNRCHAFFTPAMDTSKKFTLFLINRSSRSGTTQYKWDFGDGSVGTGRTPTHQFNGYGRFRICLTVSDGTCISDFCDTIGLDSTGRLYKARSWQLIVVDEIAFGTPPQPKPVVKIFPNPNQGKVNIEFESGLQEYEKLEILNIQGALVHEETLTGKNERLEINTEKLHQGMYIIRLSNARTYSLHKMIKQ